MSFDANDILGNLADLCGLPLVTVDTILAKQKSNKQPLAYFSWLTNLKPSFHL